MHQVVTGIIRNLSFLYQKKYIIGMKSGCFTIKRRTWYSILKTKTTVPKFIGMHFQFTIIRDITRHPTHVKMIKDHVLKAADKIPKPKVFILNFSSYGWLEFNNLNFM